MKSCLKWHIGPNELNIYRAFHPKAAEYTFSLSAPGTFSRIGHILSHKSSLGKLKKLEIISSIFSNHNAMRLEIYYRKINCKKHKLRMLNISTKQPLEHWRYQKKSKNIWRQMIMNTQQSKTYEMLQKQF